ncbi:YceK/YidQ family lipoprotein [Pseudomonas graminis]
MKALKKCHIAGFVACVSLVSTSGCSSMMMHSGPSEGYYPGTRASANVLTDKDSGWVMKPLAAIDLPFSALLDTLLLPLDYYRSGDTDSPRERVRRSEQKNHTDEVMSQTMAPYAANTPAP